MVVLLDNGIEGGPGDTANGGSVEMGESALGGGNGNSGGGGRGGGGGATGTYWGGTLPCCCSR